MNIFDPEPRDPWASRVRSVLRIVVAALFIVHGTMKLFGFPAGEQGPMPAPPMLSQIWFAGMLETYGGALLLIGLATRPVAFLLSGEMAVAYFQAHFPRSFWPTQNGGEASVLFCFVFLYFVFAGAGVWSVDAGLRRGRRS